MDVVRTGKNLLKNNGSSGSENGITWTVNSDGSVTFSGTASNTVYINFNAQSPRQFLARGSATIICSQSASYNPSIDGLNFQSDIYVDGTYVRTLQSGNRYATFTGKLIEVGAARLKVASGTVVPAGTTFYPQIELGNVQTAFEPYTGDSHSISFPQTVYGGWVDVVEGKLHVTHKVRNVSEFSWSYASNNFRFSSGTFSNEAYKGSSYTGNPDIIRSSFTPSNTDPITVHESGGLGISLAANGSVYIQVGDDSIDTDEKIKNAFGSQSIMYKLATEQVIDLDPVTIKTLLGNNNVFCNTGDTSAEYYKQSYQETLLDAVDGAISSVGTKVVTVSGTDVTINGVDNTMYMCGEVSTISIVPPQTGIIDVIFTSGTSTTVLTLPGTVKMPDWFVVEANKTYEISILNGIYGAVMSWDN